MLVPIKCFTCGECLGAVAPIYHAVRRKRMLKRFGAPGAPITPTHAANAPGAAAPGAAAPGAAAPGPIHAAVDSTLSTNGMSDVLDALRVSLCCRTRLVTAMIFSEHY